MFLSFYYDNTSVIHTKASLRWGSMGRFANRQSQKRFVYIFTTPSDQLAFRILVSQMSQVWSVFSKWWWKYVTVSILAQWLFDWSAFAFPNMALALDDAIAIYGVPHFAEPIDWLVLSIKRTPTEFFEKMELFGDSFKVVDVAKG